MSSTPLEENSGDLANRGKDQRNSAYQAIQARLKAQAEAKRGSQKQDED